MDGLWFLIAVVVLRLLWRFVERAARQGEQAPPEVSEDAPAGVPPEVLERRRATLERRRAERTRQRQRVEGQAQPTPMPSPPRPTRGRSTRPDDLLERLRRAVEAATEMAERPSAPSPPPYRPTPPHRFEEPPPEPRPQSRPASPAQPLPAAAATLERPSPSHGSSRAREFRSLLLDRGAVRDALLLREILGPPVAHRHIPQALHKR